MYFPKFWARAEHKGVLCWRWSDSSIAAALAEAQAAAKNLAVKFSNGFPPKDKTYEYGQRPLREEIIQEDKDRSGELRAVLTRNRYGALVLNTAKVMFIDIDLEPSTKPSGLASFIGGLFGKKSQQPIDPQAQAIENIKNWSKRNSSWGFRIYRTPAGLRLLATHDLFDPEKITSAGVFDELKADPLYRRLCQNQKCFRARLTPKPWRCNVAAPPARWPFENARAEKTFRAWEKGYAAASEHRAACAFLEHVGSSMVHPEVKPILELHDRMAKVTSGLALA